MPKSLFKMMKMFHDQHQIGGLNTMVPTISALETVQKQARLLSCLPSAEIFNALGSFKKNIDTIKISNGTLFPALSYKANLAPVSDFFSSIASKIQEVAEPWHSVVTRLNCITAPFQDAMNALKEKEAELVQQCIEHGWYPIEDTPISFSPSSHEFEEAMAAQIEEYLPDIEQRLCEQYPQRAHFFKKSFQAHRSNDFELSIPTLFTQAEGICVDSIGVDPFSRKNGSMLIDKVSHELSGTFGEIYFRPLLSGETIRDKIVNVAPDTLNRHAVLHGCSTEYATRINSLKLISFVASLDWLLRDLSESDNE